MAPEPDHRLGPWSQRTAGKRSHYSIGPSHPGGQPFQGTCTRGWERVSPRRTVQQTAVGGGGLSFSPSKMPVHGAGVGRGEGVLQARAGE